MPDADRPAPEPLTPERHGVAVVDRLGPECICGRDFPYESGGWVSFNYHIEDVLRAERAARDGKTCPTCGWEPSVYPGASCGDPTFHAPYRERAARDGDGLRDATSDCVFGTEGRDRFVCKTHPPDQYRVSRVVTSQMFCSKSSVNAAVMAEKDRAQRLWEDLIDGRPIVLASPAPALDAGCPGVNARGWHECPEHGELLTDDEARDRVNEAIIEHDAGEDW